MFSKRILLVLATSTLAAACGGGGGDENSNPNAEASSLASDTATKEAKNYVSSKMKDPSSVLFQNMKVYRLESDATVCGEFNAKNSFGAYVGYRAFYYRSGTSDLFKFTSQTNSTGSLAFIINAETDKLINTVCSDITKEAADRAQINYLKAILP